MLSYKYTARDPATGKKVRAEVEADSEQAAARLIKHEGLAPLDIRISSPEGKGLRRFTEKTRTKDKVIFSRQMSTLINAGLPLVQSLRTVGDQTKNKPLKVTISKIVGDVEGGAPLSVAFGKYPRVFNQVYTSMVAAGETSGTLDVSLERLANQQEKDAELISKVRGALIYPLIVVLVMVGVVGFMIVGVLPQVKELYEGLPGTRLPLITRMLLAVSDFTVRFWWLELIVIAGLGFFTTRWARTGPGEQVIDRLKMRLWPFGSLFMKLYMARFARTGATLVGSGVPLIQTLEITAQAVDNVHVEKTIMQAADKVKGGKALSTALAGTDTFLDLVPQMLKIGEDSGAIEDMLNKTADYYEKEVDNAVKSISTIIEPVLMIILGVVALTIVAAILLPIYGLVGSGIIK